MGKVHKPILLNTFCLERKKWLNLKDSIINTMCNCVCFVYIFLWINNISCSCTRIIWYTRWYTSFNKKEDFF